MCTMCNQQELLRSELYKYSSYILVVQKMFNFVDIIDTNL